MFLWKYVSSRGVFFVIVSLGPINWSGGGDNGQHSTLCGRVWQIGGCGSSIYSLCLFSQFWSGVLNWLGICMVNPTCVLYDLITFGCFRKFLNKYSVNYSFDLAIYCLGSFGEKGMLEFLLSKRRCFIMLFFDFHYRMWWLNSLLCLGCSL
jgi:hypothetical protein